MKDLEDIELKAEMDEIMRGVESVMKKVEAILPANKDTGEATED